MVGLQKILFNPGNADSLTLLPVLTHKTECMQYSKVNSKILTPVFSKQKYSKCVFKMEKLYFHHCGQKLLQLAAGEYQPIPSGYWPACRSDIHKKNMTLYIREQVQRHPPAAYSLFVLMWTKIQIFYNGLTNTL